MSENGGYDALLLVSFGGPEGPDDVLPFLKNVLRGKNVPEARMLEVAEHYQHFGGVSPINEHCRQLLKALKDELQTHAIDLPIYWGNRNWDPYLVDTIGQMAKDGVRRSLAFFTSAYSCYSGCRQYRENIMEAQQIVGLTAPRIEKLRMPYNHPGFVEPQQEILRDILATIEPDQRKETPVLFSAHSIPMLMSENSRYVQQLHETGRLIAAGAGHERWELVYQSRSGPPSQPWLEPDVCDRIAFLAKDMQSKHVIIQPIGFLSDHMEVLFDLDVEAKECCEELGLRLHRASTVGCHPRFVQMIRELIEERTQGADKLCLGQFGPSHDTCPENCCLYPRAPMTTR